MTAPRQLRSREWFDGDDEVAVAHRVALRSVGLDIRADDDRPVIGIADSSSELNPCNLPLRDLVPEVAAGIREAGGLPVSFPVMSLGEDLMKPSAMLYRNLLSVEVEEYLRSYPLDGVVLLANCDKSVPGALMGAVSANLPAVMVTGGARPIARFHGRRIGTGTDLWRALDDHRTGRMNDEEWAEFERCLNCGLGSCNTMGTATSMAVVAETLGFALPGTATLPAADPERPAAARAAGRRAVAAVADDVRPAQLVTEAALRNTVRVLHACGGSTNALLHLLAIAGRAGADLSLDDIGRLGKGVPVLADLEPSGRFLVQDMHAAGGLPALMQAIADHLELEVCAANGQSWREVLESWPAPDPSAPAAVRSPADPLRTDGAFAVVHGSLAPDGAVVKTSAASPELARHRGRAVVFRDYHDMRARIDDPDLDVTPDDVLVLAGCGPVGVPGMPEWGMIPIPARLAASGVRDMVRVTDARMSGTSFGTCVLHVAPEAAIGGPLALVRDGDPISLDIDAGRLDLEVSAEELAARRAAWKPAVSPHLRGWPALYQAHVTQANRGCDLDFLSAPTPAHRSFVPPIVGRS
ncbi:MAG TPA: dihydroxy-acid dehydratase [Acidothermaceae bacterium]|nr:dihydroxy-acid dehydratase [Acidothermaceae bacterium]